MDPKSNSVARMTRITTEQAEDVVARTIYGEARGELFGGKVAVGNVIRNRVKRGGWWGTDYEQVCKKPWQFSCWNENDPNREVIQKVTTEDPVFKECFGIARLIVRNQFPDLTFGSCHYHTAAMGWPAAWGTRKDPVIKIGAHLFYNNVD